MPDGSVPILIALVVLIILSGFFSSTETAYSCANRIKLRSLATSGNTRAKKVLDLAETNYDKLISTILIGNNIVNIVATTLATILFGIVFKNDPSTANIVSTAVMTVSILIFGEITCCSRRSPCRSCGPACRREPSSSSAERDDTWDRRSRCTESP